MVMVRHLGLSSLWLNMEALSCFGFLSLFLLWCALAILWLNSLLSKASGGGRRRSCLALPLLLPLLLFSSFSFASVSPVSSVSCADGSSIPASSLCAASLSLYAPGVTLVQSGVTFTSGSFTCDYPPASGSNYPVFYAGASIPSSCSSPSPSSGCILPSDATLVTASTWSSLGFAAGAYCDPSSDCMSFGIVTGNSMSLVTDGATCSPRNVPATAPVVSNPSPPPVGSCPVGYYIYDQSGCVCTNGSGSFVSVNGVGDDPSCDGGSPTAPVLSPVAPVTSNGVTSCPPGSASSTSGSSVSCYQIVIPPPVSPQSSPSGSEPGGGGGGSSFHLVAPTKSSNGQLVCPPGSSSISGANGSGLMCVASGPGSGGSGTAPTSSGTSGTSSAASYPTSLSMPALPGASVGSVSLGSIPAAVEVSGESCPAPVTFVVMGHTFSITFSYACGLAAKVRPVVVGVFSLASLLLLVK